MIELYSESTGWTMSPRISFSHDFPQADGIPIDRQPLLDSSTSSSSSPDFHFFAGERSLEGAYSCSADELFSNGKILPITPLSTPPGSSALKPLPPPPPPPPPPPSQSQPPSHQSKKESLREIIKTPELGSNEKPASSKAFWRFGRSTSLNCGGGSKRSLLCKLPLLNRSNSTGSVDQNEKKEPAKPTQKSKRTPLPSTPSIPSVSSLPMPLPPLKRNEKSRRGAYGNGVRINPVLNVPPPYISAGTTSLFGFGYFFRPAKDCTTKPRKRSNT